MDIVEDFGEKSYNNNGKPGNDFASESIFVNVPRAHSVTYRTVSSTFTTTTTTNGLALCHDVTLDIVTHRWVPVDTHSTPVPERGGCGWPSTNNTTHVVRRSTGQHHHDVDMVAEQKVRSAARTQPTAHTASGHRSVQTALESRSRGVCQGKPQDHRRVQKAGEMWKSIPANQSQFPSQFLRSIQVVARTPRRLMRCSRT